MREVSEALYLYLGSSFMSVCFCKTLLSYMLRINVLCYILYLKVYFLKKNPRSLLASNGYLPPSLQFQLLQHYQPFKEELEGRKEGEKSQEDPAVQMVLQKTAGGKLGIIAVVRAISSNQRPYLLFWSATPSSLLPLTHLSCLCVHAQYSGECPSTETCNKSLFPP